MRRAIGSERSERPSGSPDGDAYGRPVGVALDKRGALLVADDVGNVIWRVTATAGAR